MMAHSPLPDVHYTLFYDDSSEFWTLQFNMSDLTQVSGEDGKTLFQYLLTNTEKLWKNGGVKIQVVKE